jgi:hypothetical protein
MDYARFNYIAQPGDKGVRFIRQMGPYDHYAVNWLPRNSKLGHLKQKFLLLDKWILKKGRSNV